MNIRTCSLPILPLTIVMVAAGTGGASEAAAAPSPAKTPAWTNSETANDGEQDAGAKTGMAKTCMVIDASGNPLSIEISKYTLGASPPNVYPTIKLIRAGGDGQPMALTDNDLQFVWDFGAGNRVSVPMQWDFVDGRHQFLVPRQPVHAVVA